jgi:NADH:ubiquinone oxidoreductase subunit 6 (subunit J)
MFQFGLFSISIFICVSMYIFVLSFGLLVLENPVYSIFLLVLVFFGSSFILLELNLFFLALMILIVYLGALIVLFLFVVMMLNIRSVELGRVINFFPFLTTVVSVIFLFMLSTSSNFLSIDFEIVFFFRLLDWKSIFFFSSIFDLFGYVLYSKFSALLILLGFILFLAMVSAIVLTLMPFRYYFKQFSIDQILRLRYIETG